MLSAQMSTDVAVPPVPSGRRKTVSFPVLATYSAPPCSARPLAPKGGKPVVASWVFLATLVTHPLPPPEQPPAGIRKISPWNESETRRSPELSNTRALGAAVLFGKGNGKPGTMVQQGSVAQTSGVLDRLPFKILRIRPFPKSAAKRFPALKARPSSGVPRSLVR